jgi:hypothetical protein
MLGWLLMNFFFHDYKNLLGFKEFQRQLQLDRVNNVKDEKLQDDFTAFVHSGDKPKTLTSDWKKKVKNTERSWVIFVSSEPDQIEECVEPHTKRITRPITTILRRIKSNPQLVEKFKDSCKSASGPDMKLLEGLGCPEVVLSRYLLCLANLQLEEETLQAMGIQDSALLKEYNEFAKDSGEDNELDESSMITPEMLKNLLS